MTINSYSDKFLQPLLIGLTFFLPLSVFFTNLIALLILLIWIASGKFRLKIKEIYFSKIAKASIYLFCVYLVGLIWSSDLFWGLEMTRKMLEFLILLPILITITRHQNISQYINAFLYGTIILLILSYGVWFEILPTFKYATIENPTPLMSHISHTPIIAFASYLVGYKLLFFEDINKRRLLFICLLIFFISLTSNVFITAGRAGQLAYYLLFGLLIFQRFGITLKGLLLIIFSLTLVFFISYNSSETYKKRINEISFDLSEMDNDRFNTSIGQRITLFITH